MKRVINPILGNQVRLRLLEDADLPLTLAWRNRDEIRRWFIYSDLISPDMHQQWYQKYSSLDTDFVFIIEFEGQPVGQIALYRLDWEARTAEFGRLMVGEPGMQGKGIAREATRLLMDFGFREFKLTQIYLEVFEENTPAIAVYRRCGFVETNHHENLIRMEITPPAR